MTPLLVGVDVGTTNVKAVVYEPDGGAVAVAVVPTPTHYPRPSWAFYRPDELWAQTVKALREALAKVDDPRRVAGIAITSMGEAGVPVDVAGDPTFDAIAWFDTRTEPQVAWLEREIGREALFATTGLSLQPIWSLCKLLWLRENEPEAFSRTARWLNIADYIAYRLCGVQATDLSLASRTMALDLAHLRWSDDLLGAVGLSRDLLAPLAQSGTRLGNVTAESVRETGLPVGTPVSAGGHDHVCGALAVGVIEPGEVLNSLGTAEALF
ncbi:MAG: FGGY family carbohydrate kinase, partial [Chloroflexota bacterium]|nr:FGGY family carbohydrate kinase [Chloroflexota bacterium]